MQYARPGGNYYAGDCMPFSHDGIFHLYYLLDDSHHKGRGGLGGHQWAHLSTTDLVHWMRHPLALPIDQDWEASLCTGSILHYGGQFHAFYPTRTWERTEKLSHAISADGITFTKTLSNPFLTAPTGYAPGDFRDPFAYVDTDGRVKLLVTARLEKAPLQGLGGCVIRYSSTDIATWELEGPILFPGSIKGYASVPECPDCFNFAGRRYLLYGQALRTYYRVSDDGGESWTRPLIDTVGNDMLAVMKTAPFGENRRIGVAWIGSRDGDKDSGGRLWGGHLVFREIIALPDGSLGTAFVPEMIPDTGKTVGAKLTALTLGARVDRESVKFNAPATIEVAALSPLPRLCRLQGTITPKRGTYRFGIGLRGSGSFDTMYPLTFTANTGVVRLAGEEIEGAYIDGERVDLDIVLHDDIIDIEINGKQCLVNRLGELQGDAAFLFCECGEMTVSDVIVTDVTPAADFGC
ncbi:MAG TPA: hypothetical protein VGK19_21700 [Capsulimonadaceae bacterium]|jgi:hypothetical protein